MSKIIISEPGGAYRTLIDTEISAVEIREAWLGVGFVTDSGERLSVCMRDGGFEIRYSGDNGRTGFDLGWLELKNGLIAPGASASTPK